MSRGEQMTGPRRATTRCDDLVSVPNWNICTPRSRRSVRRRSTKERSSRTTRPGTHMLVDGLQPDGQGIAGSSTRTRHRSTYCSSCERTPSGRIRRSSRARHTFQQVHPCPSTGLTAGHCPGYVVDHIVPLKRGGADSPENMQWQSTAEAKAQDRIE
jgi:5-methylcytosine-specific restriction endonuclease McrA